MFELDFEEKITEFSEEVDFYNDHKGISLSDLDYDRLESDYGIEQFDDVIKYL
jgi:hypothetical protein